MTMIDSETCHCGTKMGRSDHCPECFCEEYEADCGRRPARLLVYAGKIGPAFGGMEVAGKVGPDGLKINRS